MGLSIVILAAGEGSRMKSAVPKVLHLLAGKPLLEHVVNTAQALKPLAIHVVFGSGGEVVKSQMAHLPVNWIEQKQRLGTGHALLQSLPYLQQTDRVLVLYGDVPLISLNTLTALLEATPKGGVGIVGANFADPTGLGRIIRDKSGNITGIVEHKDANEKQRCIQEIYTGILTAPVQRLNEWLPVLKNDNAQREYYLTDCIRLSVKNRCPVIAVLPGCVHEVEGVNNRQQLADLERYYQRQAADKIMASGATIMDPLRFDLRGNLEVGEDVTIDINVLLEGDVIIGANSYIGPNVVIRNSKIGEGVRIEANSLIDGAMIDNDSVVGPFARLRPGTECASKVRIGNFVEVKKAKIGINSKINHLSYIGDATIGQNVNIGAGTITCNYDGVNKHQTIIGDNVFIGSDTQLVAPVRIGYGATIGAGSTITRDAPAEKLTLSRAKQMIVEQWQRPQKKER